MSCTGCGSSFGLLRKEIGCELCGYAFCSNCCSKRICKKDEASVKKFICNKCFHDSDSDKKPTYSPPLAHKKRMAALSSRSQSVAAESSSSHWDNLRDREIAERLQRLKRQTTKEVTPTQGEIENRLAKLKGMDPSVYSAPPIIVYRPGERRSSNEQAADLFRQVVEEVQIDSRRDEMRIDDITDRLSRLRGSSAPEKLPSQQVTFHDVQCPEEQMDIEEESKTLEEQSEALMKEATASIKGLESDETYRNMIQDIKSKSKSTEDDQEKSDEDDEADRILKSLLEVNLEDPDSLSGVEMTSPDSDSDKAVSNEENEEFPWCVLCSQDAKVRCFGCDSDLYCMRCFSDCHDSLDIKDHKTCPYLKTKV